MRAVAGRRCDQWPITSGFDRRSQPYDRWNRHIRRPRNAKPCPRHHRRYGSCRIVASCQRHATVDKLSARRVLVNVATRTDCRVLGRYADRVCAVSLPNMFAAEGNADRGALVRRTRARQLDGADQHRRVVESLDGEADIVLVVRSPHRDAFPRRCPGRRITNSTASVRVRVHLPFRKDCEVVRPAVPRPRIVARGPRRHRRASPTAPGPIDLGAYRPRLLAQVSHYHGQGAHYAPTRQRLATARDQ